jgi:hypothetical protein
MRRVAAYLGWVAVFVLGVPLTPLGWLPSAFDLQHWQWLALLCGSGIVFAYFVSRSAKRSGFTQKRIKA